MLEDVRGHLVSAFASVFAGSFLRKGALAILLVYTVAAPIPWGAVQPGLTGTAKIAVGAFLVALFAFLAPDARPRLGWAWLPAAALAALGLLGILQLLPLPHAILRFVSPTSLEAWDGARHMLQAFGRNAPAPSISIAPRETAGVALLAVSNAFLFVAAAVLLDTRARRRAFGVTLLLSSLVQIVLAFSGEDRLTRLHGSFVNPNHFAGYLTIPLAFAFALVWLLTRRGVLDFLDSETAEERYRHIERLMPRIVVAVVLWGVVAAAIGMSQSRAGLIAALGTTLLLLVMALAYRGKGRRLDHPLLVASLPAALAAGTLFCVLNIGRIPFLRFRENADLAEDYRVLIWRHSQDAFRLFPWFGSGLGTFREAFRRVQPATIHGLVDQAHNEYLQLLVTGGVAGALLGAIALTSIAWLLVRGFFRQVHREEAAFALAGIGSLAALLLHGAAEFNFSIPAIPATLAMVAGCAFAATVWSGRSETRSIALVDPT